MKRFFDLRAHVGPSRRCADGQQVRSSMSSAAEAFSFTIGIPRGRQNLQAGFLSKRLKTRSVIFWPELNASFCRPNGSTCTSQTIGLLSRRHIIAGEFHHIGKEASTRWVSGPDLSMMAEAGAIEPADETFREYERVVDPKYLETIRQQAKQFSTKLVSRQSRVAECAIRDFENGRISSGHVLAGS